MIKHSYISAVKPFYHIWWEGTIDLGNGLITNCGSKEEPDYFSVFVKRFDGSIQCVAEFDSISQASNFVDMFKALHRNYIKGDRIKYFLFGHDWCNSYHEGGIYVIDISSSGAFYKFDEETQSCSDFAAALLGWDSYVEISKEDYDEIYERFSEV